MTQTWNKVYFAINHAIKYIKLILQLIVRENGSWKRGRRARKPTSCRWLLKVWRKVHSKPGTRRAGKSALHPVRTTAKQPGRGQGRFERGDWEKRAKEMSKLTKLFKGSSSSSSSSSSKSRHHHRSHGGPTPQEAIHKLRETEEMLTKKQDFLEKRIEQELMTAKKHGTKNKQGKLSSAPRLQNSEVKWASPQKSWPALFVVSRHAV